MSITSKLILSILVTVLLVGPGTYYFTRKSLEASTGSQTPTIGSKIDIITQLESEAGAIFSQNDNQNFLAAISKMYPSVKLVDGIAMPSQQLVDQNSLSQQVVLRYDVGTAITPTDVVRIQNILTTSTKTADGNSYLYYDQVELNHDATSPVLTFHGAGGSGTSFVLPIATGTSFLNLTVK